MPRLLQTNLNHSRGAQDLFLLTLRQWGVGLAMAAEPHAIPDHPNWVGDEGGSVAIVRGERRGSPPLSLIESGEGFVAAAWGDIAVVGCYISPNSGRAAFEQYLGEVEACVRRCSPRPVLVLGDFNSWSTAWGSLRTNARGEKLLGWAAGLDLRLLNRGSSSTCVRWNGESIVDLTWASPSIARRVSDWRVAGEVASLSDHLYITFVISAALQPGTPTRPRCSIPFPRWAWQRLDRDVLVAAAIAVAWPEQPTRLRDTRAEADRIRELMSSVCDASMPRVRSPPSPRSVYWWTREIAELRVSCARARRRYTRARSRRSDDTAMVALLHRGFMEASAALKKAIKVAKTRAWEDLLGALDADPWGRPYKMVLGKLRPWAPPETERLDPGFLGRVVDTLFPCSAGGCPPPGPEPMVQEEQADLFPDAPGVSFAEMAGAVKRLAARNSAPGPDGIPGKAWVLAMDVLGPRLMQLFDSCLRRGEFPLTWRTGRMILLRKAGKAADSPAAYRPVCLLDEAGKLFERVLASRLSRHLSEVGPDLADSQFGFRAGRSTVDAIRRVASLSSEATAQGRVGLAVSIDIVNAFNTLPWAAIREALGYHRVPPYLRAVIGAYLRGRCIKYTGHGGNVLARGIVCGVPQGSVLGPILWDLAYDAVLRTALPAGASITCYADDTLVLVGAEDWGRTIRLGELAVACAVDSIQRLGLAVSPEKTEACWFYGRPWSQGPPLSWMKIGGAYVEVKEEMKYLGIHLDSLWRFRSHFGRLGPRLEGMAVALGRLLPNMKGPSERVRRLYVGVVRSVALYGAPVWARALMSDRQSLDMLRRVERRLAIRVIRAYRTTSHAAATLLAGIPPFAFVAEEYAQAYDLRCELRRAGLPSEEAVGVRRREARRSTLERWSRQLTLPGTPSQGIIGAVLPCLDLWLGRPWGSLSYRTTQVLTGHGCFGEYLCRIGAETTAQCQHCLEGEDTARHTLEFCPAWAGYRHVLELEVGADLSLPAIVRAMVGSERSWRAVASFCEQVMLRKEVAERERERLASATRVSRRGRSGRRAPRR